jgi:hypothetical protein
MAKGKHSGGPGTYTTNGVECTLDAPFSKAENSRQGVGGGEYGANKAPFGKPQSMGGGGIPTKFFDGMSATKANTVNASMTGTAGVNRTAPVGNRRFKNPGSNT